MEEVIIIAPPPPPAAPAPAVTPPQPSLPPPCDDDHEPHGKHGGDGHDVDALVVAPPVATAALPAELDGPPTREDGQPKTTASDEEDATAGKAATKEAPISNDEARGEELGASPLTSSASSSSSSMMNVPEDGVASTPRIPSLASTPGDEDEDNVDRDGGNGVDGDGNDDDTSRIRGGENEDRAAEEEDRTAAAAPEAITTVDDGTYYAGGSEQGDGQAGVERPHIVAGRRATAEPPLPPPSSKAVGAEASSSAGAPVPRHRPSASADVEVIELLDSDSDDDERADDGVVPSHQIVKKKPGVTPMLVDQAGGRGVVGALPLHQQRSTMLEEKKMASFKRPRLDDNHTNGTHAPQEQVVMLPPTHLAAAPTATATATAAHHPSVNSLPDPGVQHKSSVRPLRYHSTLGHPPPPGTDAEGGGGGSGPSMPYAAAAVATVPPQHLQHPPQGHRDAVYVGVPEYLTFPIGFAPTWEVMMPPPPSAALKDPPPSATHASRGPPRRKHFKLSLLNVNQFTITGLSPAFGEPPTSLAGLRVPIRKIARDHGKAEYDTDNAVDGDPATATANNGAAIGGPGRWRIPLGAYHALHAYLVSDPYTRVDGIPNHQLQIASLERARQEKGYPTPEQVAERGVPLKLAKALAPFQRGGVDFVLDKGGRALIADDMGLGKTIQGIASMAVFRDEWPVLVLCPSSARYHWESEFLRWLGADDDAKADCDAKENFGTKSSNVALSSRQVNVLTNSKSDLFPYKDTKIVVCTYGLALSLVQTRKLLPAMFGCAIVDESHMLKNKSSKRSKALVPLLRSIPRCVLLSGTPALARPAELWPQLDVLGVAGRNGFWDDEVDFMNKYVRRGGMTEKAELHTMLTGTIMIRRLKHEILKDLPRKVRSQALLHVLNVDQCNEFKGLLAKLRKSKGVLGEFARSHHEALVGGTSEEPLPGSAASAQPESSTARVDAEAALRAEMSHRFHDGRARIYASMDTVELGPEARDSLLHRLEGQLHDDLDKFYADRSAVLDAQFGKLPNPDQGANEEMNRTTLLSHMYGLTGDCKIPLIVDMLRRWLADPTKGKLCIFAHHLSVLNAIRDQAGLSNDKNSVTKFIRIDGATLPRQRQDLIKKFQTDPSVRIALLGITAAGVAVTLTASSTVWFAELFWTPALMIQAEDRCHRIGQQARVNCLYFVARGTLDEILWKLIEKKFQDLGEFVEGKEKLKMVVENVFETEKELHGMFSSAEDMGEEDDRDSAADETGIEAELSLADFADDFAQLGQEECAMLQFDSDDEDEGDAAVPKADRKVPAVDAQAIDVPDESEGIIVIDDDDDDDDTLTGGSAPSEPVAAGASSAAAEGPSRDRRNAVLPDCRLYKLRILTPSLGVELAMYYGRPVVVRILESRLAREVDSGSGKPALGDIVVGVNGYPLPLGARMGDVVQHLRTALSRPPLELICAECPWFRDRILASRQAAAIELERRREAIERATDADGVIQIDDDDDD